MTPERQKNPAAVALGRLGGLKGGRARAEKLSAERRSEIARNAAMALHGRPPHEVAKSMLGMAALTGKRYVLFHDGKRTEFAEESAPRAVEWLAARWCVVGTYDSGNTVSDVLDDVLAMGSTGNRA